MLNRIRIIKFDISRLFLGISNKRGQKQYIRPILSTIVSGQVDVYIWIIKYYIPKYTHLKLFENYKAALTAELGEEKGKVEYDFYDLDAMYRGEWPHNMILLMIIKIR